QSGEPLTAGLVDFERLAMSSDAELVATLRAALAAYAARTGQGLPVLRRLGALRELAEWPNRAHTDAVALVVAVLAHQPLDLCHSLEDVERWHGAIAPGLDFLFAQLSRPDDRDDVEQAAVSALARCCRNATHGRAVYARLTEQSRSADVGGGNALRALAY